MDNQEILEHQRKMKAFQQTELGRLFERFVNLHAAAWQLDERSSWTGHDKTARKAWDEMEPVLRELREKLMAVAKVE
jgi:hypothetical protein